MLETETPLNRKYYGVHRWKMALFLYYNPEYKE